MVIFAICSNFGNIVVLFCFLDDLTAFDLNFKNLRRWNSFVKVYIDQTVLMLENLVKNYRTSDGKTKRAIEISERFNQGRKIIFIHIPDKIYIKYFIFKYIHVIRCVYWSIVLIV